MAGRYVALALVAFAASACKPAPPPVATPSAAPAPAQSPAAQASADAPPTINGMYIDKDACPGEGCYFGRMQVVAPVDLFDAPGAKPAVVGQLARGEWVDTVTTEDRYAPLRGVMRAKGEPFSNGTVIYRLGNEGEGCFSTWESGKLGSWCVDGPDAAGAITWDTTKPATDGSEGLWVQVKRVTGPGGWLRSPRDEVRCIGYQDRDPDCPALPK